MKGIRAVEAPSMTEPYPSDDGAERVPSRRRDRPTARFPGWYQDPMTPTMDRFWDGLRWTEHVRAGASLAEDLGPIEPILADFLAC